MQLHPGDASRSTEYAARSLAAGMIGLDHEIDIGDMRKASPSVLPASQRDYFHLAAKMAIGDKVLIMAHHHPVAFATVSSDYFYITSIQRELNVWFRHFRRVKDVRFVGDIVTDPKKLPRIPMTDTISSLGEHTVSFQLIRKHYA
jgi:hypothetical protein